jgi:hypothetical protein
LVTIASSGRRWFSQAMTSPMFTGRATARLDVVEILGVSLRDRVLPARAVDRLHRLGRRGEGLHARVDRQGRLVDAAELLGAGMDVHQLLLAAPG